VIICSCNKVLFDGFVLKIRVGFFRDGYMSLKCPQCKTLVQGISVKVLTGEIKEDIDFRKTDQQIS